MKKTISYFSLFLAGAIFTYFVIQWTNKKDKTEASHTIAYGIKRLNKMVVAEQNYANFYSHKSTNSYLNDFLSFDKNLLLKVDVKAQASYDLGKMDVEIDSINQVIKIRKIPELKIETFPDVEFFEINQSVLNQFSKDDLNGIKQRAQKEVTKTINTNELENKAHLQLLENLEEIYLLAKIYGWRIEDKTEFADTLKESIKF